MKKNQLQNKVRKAQVKRANRRKKITIFSMLLGATVIAGGFMMQHATAKTNETLVVESAPHSAYGSIMIEGTNKSIQEFVEPFMNKQYSNSGYANGTQDVTFFGNTEAGYTAVKIVFSIQNNKAKILSMTADGQTVTNVNELYKLC